MPVSKFVDEVERVEPGVVGDGPGDDLQGLGEHVHDQLLLSRYLDRVLLQLLGQLHLGGASSGHHLVGLEAPPHDHNSVVEGPLGLLDELLGSSPQDDSGRLGLPQPISTLGHSSKRLYLSAPICFSWNFPQVPSTSAATLLTVVWRTAPVDLATLLMSSLVTLPAQKMPRSANHWVARSPMGSFDRTILAPTSWIF